jgi:hypothetical protein
VLVVDGNALQAVNLLDFVDQVRRELLLALDLEDVVGVRGLTTTLPNSASTCVED